MAKRTKPRILQMNFHRTGTTTLWRFFERNGLRCAHMDGGSLVRDIQKNLDEGREPLKGAAESYDFLSCMQAIDRQRYITPFKYVREFTRAYPDAVFILNMRNLEFWLESRLRHWDHAPVPYVDRFVYWLDATFPGARHNREDCVAYWTKEWRQHVKKTRAHFDVRPRTRFIEFDMDNDSPQKLVDAIPEWNLDVTKWKHLNRERNGAYGDLKRTEADKRLL